MSFDLIITNDPDHGLTRDYNPTNYTLREYVEEKL